MRTIETGCTITCLPPDYCASGTELRSNGRCVKCGVGTYRKQGADPVCSQCPAGRTTPTEGAATVTDCSMGKCIQL